MERIGCTTPYGLDLDNICTEQKKSSEAYGLFLGILYNLKKAECPYPCKFLINRLTTIGHKDKANNDSSEICLKFDEYIKVTSSIYSYTELELLAELGGYVGLFLGLSVFDLRLVFNKIFNIFIKN